MGELISVIINVYNRENFVGKCIESVINQTYKNLEILIINDGSTDNTLKICETYKDERIKIITTKNLGLSMSRNVGIDNSNGKYLYFVDSDDFIEKDVIEYLYNLCKKYKVKLSTSLPLTIYDYNYVLKNKKEKIQILDRYDMLKKVVLAKETAGTTWNKLYKKDLFNNIRFENRITDDIVVTYKLVIEAEKIAYSNQIKYFYLKHKDAITIIQYEDYDRSIDLYKASLERYNYIKNIYPNFIENDIGMIRNLLRVYCVKNEKVEKFLKEINAVELFKKLFNFKILFSDINIKLKMAIILFAINPKVYKIIARRCGYEKLKKSAIIRRGLVEELITVIINVYNGEKYINKCIESVINQTYKNIEILIINDGSTDQTLKICESYTDKRIRIITTENKGLSESRNVGIENSKRRIFIFH